MKDEEDVRPISNNFLTYFSAGLVQNFYAAACVVAYNFAEFSISLLLRRLVRHLGLKAFSVFFMLLRRRMYLAFLKIL